MSSRSRRFSDGTNDYPQALLLPLQLIDPSPLVSPAVSERPETPANDFPRGVGYWLATTHRWSSYTFSGFLGIHVATIAIVPLASSSLESADRSLLLVRVLYQAPIIESAFVFGSLGLHILSGLALRIYRRRQKVKRYGAHAVSWYKDMSNLSLAGYVLVPLVSLHTSITRGLPWFVAGGSEDIGLGFVSHGFVKYPLFSWFLYTSLVGIGSYHFVQGWVKWLQPSRRWRSAINGGTVALASIWISSAILIARAGASTGHIGRLYDKLYRAYFTRTQLAQ